MTASLEAVSDLGSGALGRLVLVLAALLLVVIWASVGSAIVRKMGLPKQSRSWEWPIFTVLGIGVTGFLHLLAGAANLLSSQLSVALALGLLGVTWRDAASLVEDLRSVILAKVPVRAERIALGALFGLLLLGATAHPTDWDSQMYHLRVPLQYLREGRVYLPPDNYHAALVGVSQFATMPLLALGWVAAPAVAQLAALGMVLAATSELASQVSEDRTTRWLSIAVLLGCPMVMLVAVTPRVDLTLTLALLSGHLALLAAVRATGYRLRYCLLAGTLVGVALAVKPQAGGYALALIPLGLFAARTVRRALVTAAAASVVFLPWALKSYLLSGTPFYTLGAPGWFEPWIADIYGSHLPPESIDQSASSAVQFARAPFNPLSAFVDPFPMTIEAEGVYYALSPILLLLPVAMLLGLRDRRLLGPLLVSALYYRSSYRSSVSISDT